jgi:hypothetical protein
MRMVGGGGVAGVRAVRVVEPAPVGGAVSPAVAVAGALVRGTLRSW